jgi:transcriptional regulator with XRE-family HTH domain
MLIQKLRLQRGWSQQQLADLSGLILSASAHGGQIGKSNKWKNA